MGTGCAEDWLIASLLANCHSCLYSNEVSTYFGVPVPDLEEYLG